MESATITTDDALIAAHVQPHPWRQSPSWAVVGDRSVPIWAVIARLGPTDGDPDEVAQVAREYGMSPDAVRAAVAYYKRHRTGIDAILASNRGE